MNLDKMVIGRQVESAEDLKALPEDSVVDCGDGVLYTKTEDDDGGLRWYGFAYDNDRVGASDEGLWHHYQDHSYPQAWRESQGMPSGCTSATHPHFMVVHWTLGATNA